MLTFSLVVVVAKCPPRRFRSQMTLQSRAMNTTLVQSPDFFNHEDFSGVLGSVLDTHRPEDTMGL